MLTEKEKRAITSPQSFLSKQRKTTKFRTKKKIQEIISDMTFLIKNNSKISETFGIDVTINDNISNVQKIDNTYEEKPSSSKDPDLL